jgi:putative transcriptional regulator
MENTIRVERAKKNITQVQLAERVKISRQQLIKIEQGSDTSLKNALRIAKVFETKVDDIWTLNEYDE